MDQVARVIDYAERAEQLAGSGKSLRGKDVKKMEKPWEEREVVYTFKDGYTFEKVRTDKDLALEGQLIGHCSGSLDHRNKVADGTHIFFSLREPDGTPHLTFFCIPKDKTANSMYGTCWVFTTPLKITGYDRSSSIYKAIYEDNTKAGGTLAKIDGVEVIVAQIATRYGGTKKYFPYAEEFFKFLGGVEDSNFDRSAYNR